MKLIKYILSRFFGLGVLIKNLLYDEHLVYAHKPSIPTICVGNLAVGGTGKTPHVEFLTKLLLEHGFKVGVLSRGYKRSSSGFVEVTADTTADHIGDEPRQMKLKFPEACVAVCEDRNRGIKRMCRLYPDLDVIVLDDAFQHRRVRCGYNILLTPADCLYVDDHLLPWGRLRETKHSALRADLIVVTKCPDNMKPIQRRVITTALRPAAFQDLVFTGVHYEAPRPVFENVEEVQTSFEQLFLVAGIAQPQYLREHLGPKVLGEHIYPDHYRFLARDIETILSEFARSGASCILTTEKDAVRLRDSGLVPEDKQHLFYYLPISISLDEDDLLSKRVIRYVSEHRRKK